MESSCLLDSEYDLHDLNFNNDLCSIKVTFSLMRNPTHPYFPINAFPGNFYFLVACCSGAVKQKAIMKYFVVR